MRKQVRSSRRGSRIALVSVCGLALGVGAMPMSARAGDEAQGPYTPWVGGMGVTETVEQIMARQAAWEAAGRTQSQPLPRHARTTAKAPFAGLGPVANWSSDGVTGPVSIPGTWYGDNGTDAPQTVASGAGANYVGTTSAESGGVTPPDSMGAVGPNHVVVMTNGRVKAYNKTTGVLGTLNAFLDTFFTPAGIGTGTSDPQVRFDKASDRWIAICITIDTPNRVLVARSASNDPNGAWTFFGFQQDLATPTGDTGLLADYPSLGVDASALYVGADMFPAAGAQTGVTIWVINKASILGAGPIQVTAFRNLWSGSVGMHAPRGVDNDDPTITTGFVIGADNFAASKITYRAITNPGGAPSISANQSVAVPATVQTVFNPQQATSATRLDGIDDRIMQAKIHKNRVSGGSTLWTAHGIDVNASGVASTTGGRLGVRWYQFTPSGTTLTLSQSGTLFDSAATNPKSFWLASCATTGQGHMAIGCSSSGAGTGVFAGGITAGRLNTDAAGSIQASATLIAGASTYSDGFGNPSRWGDYSHTVVDPSDDQTMWTFQEYCNGTNTYAVRVNKLVAPPPAAVTSAAPATLTQGQSLVPVVLTGTSASGSGFYDTEPGFNRMTITTSNPGVTINSFTWVNPTTVNLTVSVTGAAATGPVTLTVTNPDGQSAAGAVLTINAASTPCYANCDGSTDIPVLSAADFSCFLAKFRAGDPGANCDGSTDIPVLSAADFSCFLAAFRAGCP